MNKDNKRKFKRIENTIIITSIICLFSFSVINIFKNKIIEKEIATNNNLKALDQEGQSYRLVLSADNVQVPVPKGYVASQIEGENYVSPEYQHTTITNKISSTPTVLTWHSVAGEQYPWTQDSNGIWISGNYGIPYSTSTLESEEFDYIKGTTLTINYTYSCANSNYLNIDLVNITNNATERIVQYKTGNTDSSFDYTISSDTYTMNDWETGRYIIRAIYSKNSSFVDGQDRAYIKASTYFKEDENGETLEVDQKTRIHDGGFVIYQLTDAELEIDPYGTSVIINNTNKDEAQATRNQYVWVPVPNIEDIVRTKTRNDGIMQFGQNYKFTNTSITKETNTGSDFYNEPRIVSWYDKTKCYLQRFSKTNKRENFLNNMQEEYTRMLKSINKYKGFYIGRYETGDDYIHTSESERCFINPKIVRYNSNINYIRWYHSYRDLEKLSGKTEEYVETGMIYDSLFDYTLKWLNETDTRSYEEIGKDSVILGNYYNNNLKYKTSANGTVNSKLEKTFRMIPTGSIIELTYKGKIYSDSQVASNNIFDIAGNVLESTKAIQYSYLRRTRGGAYDQNSYDAPARYLYYGYPELGGPGFGVRSMLVIR